MKGFSLLFLSLFGFVLYAQESKDNTKTQAWFDKIKLGGYMQLRYNDLYKTNAEMESSQGDRTYGGYDGFSLRRMRLKVNGQIHPKVYFYLQADFASDGKNLGQLRDAYFDYFIDNAGEWRFRGGQSKIPYGFENLQSSQNRLGLDRNDPLNSAVKDERDMSVGIHWAPQSIRKRFSELNKKGLKGSGDYGVAYLMIYNGQRANTLVPNVDKMEHIALRFSWPFEFSNGQYFEAGISGYTGQYVMTNVTDGIKVRNNEGSLSNTNALGELFRDQRLAWHAVYYPQPFGIQAEFNIGKGPEFQYDPVTKVGSIGEESLSGGYIQLMYKLNIKDQKIFPFTRWQYYKGGKKFELDARSYDMKEIEFGIEYQPIKAFEITTIYTLADRRYEDMTMPINHQKGQLIRIQLQVNY
nr:porin [uncultured Carboxylicivirga sp.]